MAYIYLVPKDTSHLSRQIEECPNFGLKLARYVPEEAVKETRSEKSKGTVRNDWLKTLCSHFDPDTELITSVHQRWMAMTENSARFTMITRSRLTVGLGGKGALEFGITLHPVTGLPYIPGSALKGLCRNYTLYYIAEQSGISLDPANVKNTSEVVQQLDEQLSGTQDHGVKVDPDYAAFYQNLFGTQSHAGNCVFYDAVVREIPADTSLFAVEVMTPHFRKYYESGGKDAPHDADDPNPITYLAVNTGIPFRFAVGLRKSSPPETPRGDAGTLLQEALQAMGIGAKTAAGYGVFARIKTKKNT